MKKLLILIFLVFNASAKDLSFNEAISFLRNKPYNTEVPQKMKDIIYKHLTFKVIKDNEKEKVVTITGVEVFQTFVYISAERPQQFLDSYEFSLNRCANKTKGNCRVKTSKIRYDKKTKKYKHL